MASHGFLDGVRELSGQISVLVVSGVAGGTFRAIVSPETKWQRRAVQIVAGVLSATFLGGLLGFLISSFIDAGWFAYSAAGFIMGSGGEAAVATLQNRVLGRNGK